MYCTITVCTMCTVHHVCIFIPLNPIGGGGGGGGTPPGPGGGGGGAASPPIGGPGGAGVTGDD